MEPRISGVRAESVSNNLGFDGIVRSDVVGYAGGIWCLWKRSSISIDVISTSKYCILLKVNPRAQSPWVLSIVYGSLQERYREDLLNELREIQSTYKLPWCVAGDFNAVLHAHEKEGGGAFNQRAGQSFAQCIYDCSLVDLGYKGPLFTWRSGSLRERLDRALANTQWQTLFPNVSVVNLPLLTSDHCAIWLRPKGEARRNDHHYFKFLGGWLDHENFHV